MLSIVLLLSSWLRWGPKIDKKFNIVPNKLFPLKIDTKISFGKLELPSFNNLANSEPS